jgi:hypothetical protein
MRPFPFDPSGAHAPDRAVATAAQNGAHGISLALLGGHVRQSLGS